MHNKMHRRAAAAAVRYNNNSCHRRPTTNILLFMQVTRLRYRSEIVDTPRASSPADCCRFFFCAAELLRCQRNEKTSCFDSYQMAL